MYALSATIGDENVNGETIMQGIQYCRVHSPVELIAMIRILGEIVQSQPKVIHLSQTKMEMSGSV